MSERRKSSWGIVLGIGLLVVSAGAMAYQFHDSSGPRIATSNDDKAFFTVDDGKSYFEDSALKVPPFDHDGKPAVRVYLYQCSGKTIIGHLERYTTDGAVAKLKIEQSSGHGPPDSRLVRVMNAGREVKKPGDEKWMDCSDFKKVAEYTTVKCPEGGEPELVTPP